MAGLEDALADFDFDALPTFDDADVAPDDDDVASGVDAAATLDNWASLIPEIEHVGRQIETRDPFEPREFIKRETGKRLCSADTETDPFYRDENGAREPKVFTIGFWDQETYVDFWGDDCIEQFIAYLETRRDERLLIYVHNLGGFDYKFLSPYIDEGTSPTIINGRVSAVWIGGQEWRDSYRILPVALKVMQKDDFDYRKLERSVREQNKDEILLYQRHDCEGLLKFVIGFFDYFGERPTIGNTAISYLQHFHGFERIGESADTKLRPFFMGGRCQAFLTGVFDGAWKVYDVNSMYPAAMRNFSHPLSGKPIVGRGIHDATAFVCWEGENFGAVPSRGLAGDLDFNVKRGRFYTTIHEYKAALETQTIRVNRIVHTIGFHKWGTFAAFIDHFYKLRLAAKVAGDKMGDLFYKLIMNSAYGKFAQDPRKFENYLVSVCGEGAPDPEELASKDNPNGWRVKTTNGDVVYWARPSANRFRGFFNVGIGASITGAARSVLLRAIRKAKRLAYTDTDSLICEGLEEGPGIMLDESELGAWKEEARGDVFACGGKKMYALFSRSPIIGKDGEAETAYWKGEKLWCVKKASKGAALTAAEILAVALGDVVRYKSDRPNFKLDGSVEFIERDIRRTTQ